MTTDLSEFCTLPFRSCLSLVTEARVVVTDSHDAVMQDRFREFMKKAHFGTATLTHLCSYGGLIFYTSDDYPEYIWLDDQESGFPQPKTVNKREYMTDRFWEVVIQHASAATTAREQHASAATTARERAEAKRTGG